MFYIQGSSGEFPGVPERLGPCPSDQIFTICENFQISSCFTGLTYIHVPKKYRVKALIQDPRLSRRERRNYRNDHTSPSGETPYPGSVYGPQGSPVGSSAYSSHEVSTRRRAETPGPVPNMPRRKRRSIHFLTRCGERS